MISTQAKLIERIRRTPTIESFRFQPDQSMDFVPGQHLRVMFDSEHAANGLLNKFLSFSCPPGAGYIEVTKRLSSSDFSSRLKSLQPGQTVVLKGPMGDCVYHGSETKIGFLIGGIGITPVMSILGYLVEKGLPTSAGLLFSNRNEEEIPFRAQLEDYARRNDRVQFFLTVDQQLSAAQDLRMGRINKEMIEMCVPDISERIMFIFGPPAMVKAMKELCLDCGCRQDNIRTESFFGY